MQRPLPVRHQTVERRPRLLPHQPALVEFVQIVRYATAAQVQRRFPTWLRSLRTAQYQLAGLVQAGYLGTTPVRAVGPNFPFVYRVTQQGINLIRDAYAKLGIQWTGARAEEGRRTGAGSESLLHELLVSETILSLYSTVEASADLDCLFIERRYFRAERALTYADGGRTIRVVPDAGFMVCVADGPAILNFLELDNATESVARIARKYRQYAAWAASGQDYLGRLFRPYGAASQRPNFRLLMVAHAGDPRMTDDRRLLDLIVPALDLAADMRDRVWLTTGSRLLQHQDDRSPLDAPIWLRARDMRPWLAGYRTLGSQHSATTTQDLKRRRQFVADRLGDLPRHGLFPRAAGPQPTPISKDGGAA